MDKAQLLKGTQLLWLQLQQLFCWLTLASIQLRLLHVANSIDRCFWAWYLCGVTLLRSWGRRVYDGRAVWSRTGWIIFKLEVFGLMRRVMDVKLRKIMKIWWGKFIRWSIWLVFYCYKVFTKTGLNFTNWAILKDKHHKHLIITLIQYKPWTYCPLPHPPSHHHPTPH